MIYSLVKNNIQLYKKKKKWRKLNLHNETRINSHNFPIHLVTVGKGTYGFLNVYSWGSEGEKLCIGDYTSIADGVRFLLGGNHEYKYLSTYPYKVKVLNEPREATTKGSIVIEDDVWIGMDSMILSGVTIGKGAIVAAGSTVTRDVEPYSIVGGNPAKHIKYRFSSQIREKLLKFNFEELDNEMINKNIDLLYTELTEDNIDKLFSLLKK
jgi:hypothetical protein